nr:hypothetical protein [Tanacetum cinerariifolium]
MRTRSQSRKNFPQQEASLAIVEPLRIEFPFLEDQFQEDPPKDPPEVLMADDRTMAELLRAPTECYEDAIVIPEITANMIRAFPPFLNSKIYSNSDKGDYPMDFEVVAVEKEEEKGENGLGRKT